jgi:hypothetical protein
MAFARGFSDRGCMIMIFWLLDAFVAFVDYFGCWWYRIGMGRDRGGEGRGE